MCVISANLYDEPLASLSSAQWFERAAPLYPLTPTYQRRQLKHLLAISQGDTTAARYLGHLARACQLITRRSDNYQTLLNQLAQLALKPHYLQAAETLARVIYNYQLYDPEGLSPLPYQPSPTTVLPASLVRALLTWPDNDKRLPQVIQALENRPNLTETLCRYATSYTLQRRTLPLKSALLLIGPQRSRELVLLAHLESTVFCQTFPLRNALIERKRFLTHVIHALARICKITLPCRAELLSCLLLVDAWRHPRWNNAVTWQEDPHQPLTSINRWLYSPKPLHTLLSARLCQYWQLPSSLQNLFSNSPSPTANSLAELLDISIAAVFLASSVRKVEHTTLHVSLRTINYPSPEKFPAFIANTANQIGYCSPLTKPLRP